LTTLSNFGPIDGQFIIKTIKKKLFKGFDLNLEKNEYTLFYQTSNEWCITYVLIEKQKLPGLLIVFQNSIG
jgi:hypothetical protein